MYWREEEWMSREARSKVVMIDEFRYLRLTIQINRQCTRGRAGREMWRGWRWVSGWFVTERKQQKSKGRFRVRVGLEMVVLTKTQEGALEADFAQDGQDRKKVHQRSSTGAKLERQGWNCLDMYKEKIYWMNIMIKEPGKKKGTFKCPQILSKDYWDN